MTPLCISFLISLCSSLSLSLFLTIFLSPSLTVGVFTYLYAIYETGTTSVTKTVVPVDTINGEEPSPEIKVIEHFTDTRTVYVVLRVISATDCHEVDSLK